MWVTPFVNIFPLELEMESSLVPAGQGLDHCVTPTQHFSFYYTEVLSSKHISWHSTHCPRDSQEASGQTERHLRVLARGLTLGEGHQLPGLKATLCEAQLLAIETLVIGRDGSVRRPQSEARVTCGGEDGGS